MIRFEASHARAGAARRLGALLLGAALLALAAPAGAIPRFAARYGQSCILCHQDPTGGAMRSLYASQFLVPRELAMRRLSTEQMANISPQIGKNLIVGADVQTLFLSKRDVQTGFGVNGFFQMQASLYLDFQLSDRWSVLMSRRQSSGADGLSYGGVQSFGLGFVLPWNGYVKVGRFLPAFGLGLEDHTAFVRQYLGLAPPNDSDSGLELGVYPGHFAVNVAVLNGALGSSFDYDNSRALLGRAGGRFRLGKLLLSAGGSVWRNKEAAGRRWIYGPFGSASLGPLTWLGEFDWSRLDSTAAGAVTALILTQELSCQVVQGLDLRGTYSFEDPNVKFDGATQSRWGAGFDARIYPFLRLEALVNFWRFRAGPEVADSQGNRIGYRYTESALTAHFFY